MKLRNQFFLNLKQPILLMISDRDGEDAVAAPARAGRGEAQHGPRDHGRPAVDGGRQAEVSR